MPISSAQRAWIVLAGLACLTLAVALAALRHHRQVEPPTSILNPGPAPNLLGGLPPEAPCIGYADVDALRGLKDSPLAAFLGLTSSGPQTDRDYEEFVRNTGFDYTRDLDNLAIAYWPAPLGSSSTGTHPPADDARLFAIAVGRFDQTRIEAYALRTGKIASPPANVAQRPSHAIYEVPGDPPVAFEFLSPSQVALVSGKNSESFLWSSSSSPRDAGMQASIDRVAGAPIFAVMRTDRLPPDFYADFHNSPQLVHLVRSVKSLTLAGQPDGESLDLTLDGESDSTMDATAIATLIDGFRMFGSMAFSDPKTRGEMTKEQAAFLQSLISDVIVTHQGVWVRLSLAVTPKMLGVGPSTK